MSASWLLQIGWLRKVRPVLLQVAVSCGEQCATLLARTYAAIDALLSEPTENAKIKECLHVHDCCCFSTKVHTGIVRIESRPCRRQVRFGAETLSDGDFRYLLADSGSMAVQCVDSPDNHLHT